MRLKLFTTLFSFLICFTLFMGNKAFGNNGSKALSFSEAKDCDSQNRSSLSEFERLACSDYYAAAELSEIRRSDFFDIKLPGFQESHISWYNGLAKCNDITCIKSAIYDRKFIINSLKDPSDVNSSGPIIIIPDDKENNVNFIKIVRASFRGFIQDSYDEAGAKYIVKQRIPKSSKNGEITFAYAWDIPEEQNNNLSYLLETELDVIVTGDLGLYSDGSVGFSDSAPVYVHLDLTGLYERAMSYFYPKGKEKYFELLRLGAQLNDTRALDRLIYEAENERDYSSAYKYYSKLADLGKVKALTRMAHMNLKGTGVLANRDKALELYKKAAAAGDSVAAQALDNIVFDDAYVKAINGFAEKNDISKEDRHTCVVGIKTGLNINSGFKDFASIPEFIGIISHREKVMPEIKYSEPGMFSDAYSIELERDAEQKGQYYRLEFRSVIIDNNGKEYMKTPKNADFYKCLILTKVGLYGKKEKELGSTSAALALMPYITGKRNFFKNHIKRTLKKK